MKTHWIDQAVLGELGELETDDTPDLVSELIATFLETSSAYTERISSSVEAGDPARLARDAHALKASAYSLGAMELGKLCQELEDRGGQNNPDSSRQTALLLLDALSKARFELKALKEERDLSPKAGR